jgi:hypothetical protein
MKTEDKSICNPCHPLRTLDDSIRSMEDSLSTIAALTKSGYGLTLHRNAFGVYWADLRRGWILRKHVRIDLDRDPTELLLTFG